MSREVDWKECRYCGQECRGKSGLRSHMTSKHEAEVSTTDRCNWCGSDVEINEWKLDERNYCSRDCAHAWTSYIRLGKRHPSYKDGSSRSWDYNRLADVVRKRDGECLSCGADKAGDSERRLHVHHITPEDDTENPHLPTNLISLCAKCHKKLERMDPTRQLNECGLSGREQLTLPDSLRDWYEDKKGSRAIKRAPEPWFGMFEEAQNYLAERENNA